MKRRTILSLGIELNRLFTPYGRVVNDPQILVDDTVDIVVFPGGPDVPPSMYHAKSHPKTHTSHQHYQRFEDVYKKALAQGSTCVGICGGSQYLCVKAGGKLVQHVDNHGLYGTHKVESLYGPADVSSTHHQMMNPTGIPHELLAWADGLSDTHQDGEQEEILLLDNKEPEAVWFRDNNSLAVQWHPEYLHKGHSGYELFHKLVENYVI